MTDLSRNNRLMALALFLWASGEGLFYYLQPIYIQQLGASPVQIGGVLSLAGFSMALAYLPGGILADRISRKIVMSGGWGLGIVAALMMAAARDWRGFIPGAMLYTFSVFCVPAINATVADSAGDVPLERALTLVMAGYSAGSIVSPWAGGWLARLVSMRAVYIIAAVCYTASMLVMLMIQPRPARVQVSAGQIPSAAALRSGGLLGLVVFAMFLAMCIGQPLAPNFLNDTAGWSVERIGLLGSLNALGMTVLGPALGRWGALHKRWGVWIAQTFVWVSLGLLWAGAQIAPGLVFMAFFIRSGSGACRSLVEAQIVGRFPVENRGVAFGLCDTSIASAQTVAPYLAGWLYQVRPAAPILAGLALIPLTMLLAPALGHRPHAVGRAGGKEQQEVLS